MQLLESFKSLNDITGYANMIKEPLAGANCVENFLHMYGAIIMFFVCLLLLYLAIKKNYEPLLLLPIGFGGILANIPVAGIAEPGGFLYTVYKIGIDGGLFPLFIFMGVGAMTDFGPLLANPKSNPAYLANSKAPNNAPKIPN